MKCVCDYVIYKCILYVHGYTSRLHNYIMCVSIQNLGFLSETCSLIGLTCWLNRFLNLFSFHEYRSEFVSVSISQMSLHVTPNSRRLDVMAGSTEKHCWRKYRTVHCNIQTTNTSSSMYVYVLYRSIPKSDL